MTQERDHPSQWSHQLQDDLMREDVVDEEFSKFLDLGDGFQFSDIEPARSGLDTPMGQLGFGQSDVFQPPPDMYMPGAYGHSTSQGLHTPLTNPQHYDPYHQYRQGGMPPQYHVPPTPLTSEMNAAKYGHRVDQNGRVIVEGLQTSFTPLVSPAQTPLETNFNIMDYGINDEFFSPLTSPAIEAQTAYHTGSTASPIDLAGESSMSTKGSTSAPRRSRGKGSISVRTPARSVKQSPAMKPQRTRRRPSLNNLSIDEVEGILQQSSHGLGLQPRIVGMKLPPSSDESVSPEPLSESIMRPPPVPLSSSRSPHTLAAPSMSSSKAPVTPATLMRMPSNQQLSLKVPTPVGTPGPSGLLEDIMLPDAAAVSLQNDQGQSHSDQSTPTLPAMSSRTSDTNAPRAILSRGLSQESFAKPNKIDSKAGARPQKKRPNPASANISPAIRPKISPSISPLVPAPGPGMSHLSAETTALYLASKSNYQNILDGTHLPGVSYPDALAENLSSKRTSHKIAEQGRRNRINLALKEIESLLPPAIIAAVVKKEKSSPTGTDDGDKPGGPGASKASTVEMAIIYIKSLQSELQATEEKLEITEKKLAEVQRDKEEQRVE